MWTGRGWISLVRVSCAVVVVVVGRGGQRQVAAATTCGPEFALPVGRCWCCAGSWLVSPGQPRGEEQPWQWIWNETREYCEKRAMRGLIPKALGMLFLFPFFGSHSFFLPYQDLTLAPTVNIFSNLCCDETQLRRSDRLLSRSEWVVICQQSRQKVVWAYSLWSGSGRYSCSGWVYQLVFTRLYLNERFFVKEIKVQHNTFHHTAQPAWKAGRVYSLAIGK